MDKYISKHINEPVIFKNYLKQTRTAKSLTVFYFHSFPVYLFKLMKVFYLETVFKAQLQILNKAILYFYMIKLCLQILL